MPVVSARFRNYVPEVIRTYAGAWAAQRDAALSVDPYLLGNHPLPIASSTQSAEEQQALRRIAGAPYGRMILKSCTQALRVKDLRVPGETETPEIFQKVWLRNRMKGRQNGITRSAIGYGVAYTLVLPGELGINREKGVTWTNFTPKTMTAFYAEDYDEYPMLALNGIPQVDSEGKGYWLFMVVDDEAVHYAEVRDLAPYAPSQMKITYLQSEAHGVDVCPIVRHSPLMDDDGGSRGEILPFLPILKRIDQTLYDRLLIQRRAAWEVRWATGITRPKNKREENEMKATLRIGDVLTAEDTGAKFGSLGASDMSGHSGVIDADLRVLAATSQTPSYMVTGEAAQVGAEALAAITSGYHQKIEEYKDSLAVSLEQSFTLSAHIDPSVGSVDVAYEARWAEFRPYSLTQISDSLGKLAQQLEIPPDQLFEYVPFFTSDDIDRARDGREEAKEEALAQAQAEAAAARALAAPGEQARNQSKASARSSFENKR